MDWQAPFPASSRLTQWLGPVTGYHVLVFLGCWLGGIFDGMDSSLYIVVQHDALSDLLQTSQRAAISQTGSWVMAVFLVGWTLGGIAFGAIGDRFGRVSAMVCSILLYAVFTGACGLAQSVEQLALFRFLTGFGIGGELVTIATMLQETWPEKSRSVMVGALITSYQAGVFLAGLLPVWIYTAADAFALAPWRIVFFVGIVPALLAVVLRLNLHEPEVWLEQKAKAALQQDQPQSSNPIRQAWAGRYRRDLLVGASLFGAFLVMYWASAVWLPTWIQDLVGPGSNGTEKSWSTMAHGLAAVVGCLFAGPLANTLGRRVTLIYSFAGIMLATAWMMLSNTVFTPIIYWQDALVGFFYGLGQACLYIYLPELFPTLLRATATGFCLNLGRVVTIGAVLLVGPIVQWLGGYSQAVLAFSLMGVVGIAASLAARETNGQPLPE